jgi:hypothetical protein
MVTEPTVLILGAGASADYGFPLGKGLRDLVSNIKDNSIAAVIQEAGYPLDRLLEFVDKLRHSGFTSVDWFLEERPEYIEVGKAAIAASLIPYEDPSKLFPPHAPQKHWYELLLNVLDDPLGNFESNNLSIITFNYDRSIEHYLFTALSTRYGLIERAVDVMNKFPIVHVHGSLGGLLPLEKNGRRYESKITPESIRIAANEIIIVGEASGDTAEFERARSLLKDAKRIVFLGFGYHPESVKRLGIFNERWNSEMREKVRVGGTSREIPSHTWSNIQANILNGAFPANNRKIDPVFRYLYEAEPL